MAVSYTHLDVYKRQALPIDFFICRVIMNAISVWGVCALKGVVAFFRREPVLVISALAALLSMLAVPPSAAYIEYIDLRVLCLLFCLMAVVDGLKGCGLFAVMAQRMLTGRGSLRRVTLILVLLPFFTSMLVTNDVSLITFVPFAVLKMCIRDSDSSQPAYVRS